MNRSAQCIHLRERDNFDRDYDLRDFDAAETHWCTYFHHTVIPAERCGRQCSGYSIELASGNIPRTEDRRPDTERSSKVTKKEMQERLRQVLERADTATEGMRSASQLAQEKAQLQQRAAELNEVEREMLQYKEAIDKFKQADPLALWWRRVMGDEGLDNRSRTALAAYDRIKDHIEELGKGRNALIEGNKRPEQLLAELEDEEQRSQRIRKIRDVTETRVTGALRDCADPLLILQLENITRFLEDARHATIPGVSMHELDQITARLQTIRIT